MINKQVLNEHIFKDGNPWRSINDLVGNHLKGKYEILFNNIKDGCRDPQEFKFLVFGWEELKVLMYREPKLQVFTFTDYNELLFNIKKNTPKLLEEGLNLNDNDNKDKRIYLFKDLDKPGIQELKKGDKVLRPGDFLNTCWGYDQTNIETFVIKKIIGKNYLIIQEIAQEYHETEGPTAERVSVGKAVYKIDIPIKAFISNDGYIHICEYGYQRGLHPTQLNEIHYKTALGFGH